MKFHLFDKPSKQLELVLLTHQRSAGPGLEASTYLRRPITRMVGVSWGDGATGLRFVGVLLTGPDVLETVMRDAPRNLHAEWDAAMAAAERATASGLSPDTVQRMGQYAPPDAPLRAGFNDLADGVPMGQSRYRGSDPVDVALFAPDPFAPVVDILAAADDQPAQRAVEGTSPAMFSERSEP